LYAHNILWNRHNDCLLGDFGAASFTPQHDTELACSLERIEVRAFACLLEELLEHCKPQPENQQVMHALGILQQRCAQPEVSMRPAFSEIVRSLKLLTQSLNNSAVIND